MNASRCRRRVMSVATMAVVAAALVPSAASAAGWFQYYDGTITPSLGEVLSEAPSGHNLTRSSARKLSGLSAACAAGRNNAGVLVGQWGCAWSVNGLAEVFYDGFGGRAAVCGNAHPNDGHAVNLRCREDYA